MNFSVTIKQGIYKQLPEVIGKKFLNLRNVKLAKPWGPSKSMVNEVTLR